MDKIYVGKIDTSRIYLYKHKWDCNWYWSLGYLGNDNLHFHLESLLQNETNVNVIFNETKLSQDQWWIIRDLFIQAYALKKCAEVYQYGGHQTTEKGITDIIKNKDKADAINKDLEIVLNTVWNYIINALNKKGR